MSYLFWKKIFDMKLEENNNKSFKQKSTSILYFGFHSKI